MSGFARLDALRERGWAVAVHNDYRLKGRSYTFWLLTKGDLAAKGEGLTDMEALFNVERNIDRLEPATRAQASAPNEAGDRQALRASRTPSGETGGSDA